MSYSDFIESKIIESVESGFRPGKLNDSLFEWQAKITEWALRKGKAALFLDTGLGKTLCQLEWARCVHEYIDLPVLILAPLAVSIQTLRESVKFSIDCDVVICETQDDVINGINITNYEKLHLFDTEEFGGIVLDESSILKSYSGKIKQDLINRFHATKYKLCCTATPSPNDHMEILNHAAFLGVLKSHEALAIWFINDTMNMGTYRLKKYAVGDFWRWVSSWAVGISKPSDIGYDDNGFILPPINLTEHVIEVDDTDEGNGTLFREPMMSATGYHKEKRITSYDRAVKSAAIVSETSEQYMVWCDTNYDADELKKLIPDVTEVRGSDTVKKKEASALAFIDGKIRVMVSKPKIFGFGLNFQQCHNVIFCGMSYSYESYYQAVRRFWRFGQRDTVNVHIIMAHTEKSILSIIHRKEGQHIEMKNNMVNDIDIIKNDSASYKLDFDRNVSMEVPGWM